MLKGGFRKFDFFTFFIFSETLWVIEVSFHQWTLEDLIWDPIWVQNGPKLGPNGPKQHLWGLGGPRCPKMGGTRWNKVGRGMANLNCLLGSLYSPLNAQIGSQGGPKYGPTSPKKHLWGYDGPKCSKMGEKKVEQGWNGVWPIWADLHDPFRAQLNLLYYFHKH